MRKITIFTILFLLFKTIGFAEIREPKRMERITCEVIRVSEFETNPDAQTNRDEEKEGWVKRHPIVSGILIGFGIGAGVGQIYSGDFSVWGKAVFFGGIGAGVGALAGAAAKLKDKD